MDATAFGRKGPGRPLWWKWTNQQSEGAFLITVSKDTCLLRLSSAGVIERWGTGDRGSTFLGYLPDDAEGWLLEAILGPQPWPKGHTGSASPTPFLVRGRGGTPYYVMAGESGGGLLMRDVTRTVSEAQGEGLRDCCSILDGADDLALVVNEVDRVVFASLRALERLGFVDGELLGRPVAEVLPQYAAGCDLQGVQPLRAVRRDGSSFIAEMALVPWQTDEGPFQVAWLRDRAVDVSLRGAYRKAERGFRALIAGVDEYAIVTLQPDGRVVSWNRGAERLSGYAAAEVLGQHVSILHPVEERVAGRPDTALETARREGLWVGEGGRLRKNGSRFIASEVLTAVRGRSGELRGFTLITRDVTAMRKQQLLREERQAMAERQQMRRRFVQIAAHEIRNPMAGIKGMLGLVRERIAAGHPVRRPEVLLGMMEREVDRLAQLTDGMFEAFHTEDPDCRFDLAPQDLRDAVRAALGPFDEAGGRTFCVRLGQESAPVTGDALRLVQVFSNLISNAVKYSAPGSTIGVRLSQDHSDVQVMVWDHGIGIPAQDLPMVFKDFFRASNLKGIDPGGMGLGLQLCRHIVERHSGRIWLESVENLGTRVHVSIPRSAL